MGHRSNKGSSNGNGSERESLPGREQQSRKARDRFRAALTTAAASRLRPEKARSEVGSRAEQERKAGAVDYLSIKAQLHERLLDEIGERNLLGAGEEIIEEAVGDFVRRVLDSEELPLNGAERDRLADELLEETLGVGPLAPLMVDPAVTDILVNGPERVWVERFGRLERTEVRFRDDDHIRRVIERIAARVGRRIDMGCPMVDVRMPDGSRVNATVPPASIDGPTLSIRRFGTQRLRRDDLSRLRMWSTEMVDFLDHAVRARKSILVAGGTGAGKSTVLGALAEAIPNHERIITIEDTAELVLDQEHVVRLETRPPNIEGRGLITARDLVINSLRMRPDRIIMGEVRGSEALDLLQALNTGHDGGLSTIHANSARDALSRMETMVLMAGLDLPSRAIREQIVSAIQLIVFARRYEDGVRRIDCIAEITGIEGNTPLMQDIFRFHCTGRKGRHVVGEYQPTGVVPRMAMELRDQGFDFPLELFAKPKGYGNA